MNVKVIFIYDDFPSRPLGQRSFCCHVAATPAANGREQRGPDEKPDRGKLLRSLQVRDMVGYLSLLGSDSIPLISTVERKRLPWQPFSFPAAASLSSRRGTDVRLRLPCRQPRVARPRVMEAASTSCQEARNGTAGRSEQHPDTHKHRQRCRDHVETIAHRGPTQLRRRTRHRTWVP